MVNLLDLIIIGSGHFNPTFTAEYINKIKMCLL